MENEQQRCFVIAPIGEPESDVRRRSDKILQYVIRPVVESRGYQAQRADEISELGFITTQVITRLIEDPLVIADLTGQNPNVFYELAIRHAVNKPVIQLIEQSERIPFDVAPMRTIEINLQDIESVELAKRAISEQIETAEKDPKGLSNPFSMSIDLQRLRGTGLSADAQLAQILEGQSTLIASIAEMFETTESRIRVLQIQQQRSLSQLMGVLVGESKVSDSAPTSFQTGQRVSHKHFGEGIVVSSIMDKGDNVVTVAFKGSAGVKRLLTTYAPLEEIP